MSVVPLDVQRRCEKRWADKFALSETRKTSPRSPGTPVVQRSQLPDAEAKRWRPFPQKVRS